MSEDREHEDYSNRRRPKFLNDVLFLYNYANKHKHIWVSTYAYAWMALGVIFTISDFVRSLQYSIRVDMAFIQIHTVLFIIGFVALLIASALKDLDQRLRRLESLGAKSKT